MNSATYRFLTLIAVLSLVSIGMLYGQTAVTGGIEGNVTDTSACLRFTLLNSTVILKPSCAHSPRP